MKVTLFLTWLVIYYIYHNVYFATLSLPTGSFMIRGRKNYLPPYQLVLGFGLLFRMTVDSIDAHKNERSRKPGVDGSDMQSLTLEVTILV